MHRVLLRHEELRVRDDDRTERALIEDLAQPLFGSFLHDTARRAGEKANDILDALRPDEAQGTAGPADARAHESATANTPDKGRKVADWRELILAAAS